eukprot:TRINITY_DN29750_c0_g1_i1.p1 TRINITY_DN29750_c0_g1~~TRINITY_DN29750_c0_g1_i1.p1  ORF type:complete len:385 (+),score=74.21 TRINITY_DN29750_c0_g1_i1:671-1825(+)
MKGTVVLLVGFLLAVFASRQFALSVRHQINVVRTAVLVSENVAGHLCVYEVEAAEEALASADAELLPPKLRASFELLIANLGEYRKFLPQSCLVDESVECDATPDSRASASYSARSSLHPANLRRLSSESRAESVVCAPVACRVAKTSVHKVVTLLCSNAVGFLEASRGQVAEVQHLIAELVWAFGRCVDQRNGVVDLISGDHQFASFNASRPCATHATRALLSSVECSPNTCLRTTMTVATGKCLCGNFGSEEIRRFMVIGSLPVLLGLVDRLAVRWKVGVVASGPTLDDSDGQWRTECLGAVRFAKCGAKAVPLHTVHSRTASANEEWMYTVREMNESVVRWLDCVARGQVPKSASAGGCSSLQFVELAEVGIWNVQEHSAS